MSGGKIELTISPDGNLESLWFAEQMVDYICDLCGKKGSDGCQIEVPLDNGEMMYVKTCTATSPFCG